MRFFQLVIVYLLAFTLGQTASANMPIRNTTFNLETAQFGGYQPGPKLAISRDNGATTAKLILPKDVRISLNGKDTPRMASTLPSNVLGLVLIGSFIAGGLWLAHVPRGKYVSMIVVLAVAVIGTTLHAQPARLEGPRDVLERGKIHISRDASATSIQLILPKKAAD